jgi:hypothetical protein
MSSTNNTYLNDDHQLRLKTLKLENDALELAISNLREKSKKLAYFISVHQQACTHVDENRKLQIKKIGFEANKRWWGKWERDNIILSNNGDLFIREVNEQGFYFDLLVQNGAYLGNIENKFAKFTAYNEALFEFDF